MENYDEDMKADCIIVFTSCEFRFKPLLILCELKASKQVKEVVHAKQQIKSILKRLKEIYRDEWKTFSREKRIVSVIIHNTTPKNDEEIEGVKLFYLENPVSGIDLRKKVILKLKEYVR